MKNVICFYLVTFFMCANSYAQRSVECAYADSAPSVDGMENDPAWSSASVFITHDPIADIDINFQTVYSGDRIYFLIRYPDNDESRQHKNWHWDEEKDMYIFGPEREDTFVIKWNMGSVPVDLDVYGDDEYSADIWYWKSVRTDPAGYADDKNQIYSRTMLEKSNSIKTKSGSEMFLLRRGDSGTSAYTMDIKDSYAGDVLPSVIVGRPDGSRADIAASGQWKNGEWVIEFSRKLITGYPDDIQLDISGNYQFGLSRYEIAGRDKDDSIDEPFFGSGNIGETFILTFFRKTDL